MLPQSSSSNVLTAGYFIHKISMFSTKLSSGFRYENYILYSFYYLVFRMDIFPVSNVDLTQKEDRMSAMKCTAPSR